MLDESTVPPNRTIPAPGIPDGAQDAPIGFVAPQFQDPSVVCTQVFGFIGPMRFLVLRRCCVAVLRRYGVVRQCLLIVDFEVFPMALCVKDAQRLLEVHAGGAALFDDPECAYVFCYRVDAQVTLLMLAWHASDANEQFFADLVALYRAEGVGDVAALSARRGAGDEVVLDAAVVAYWRYHFDGPVLELPICRSPESGDSLQYTIVRQVVPGVLVDAVRLRFPDVPLGVLLFAVFQVVVLRYTDQTDVCIGVGLDDVLGGGGGMLGKRGRPVLPLRLRVLGRISFQGLVGMVCALLDEMRTYVSGSFAQVMEGLSSSLPMVQFRCVDADVTSTWVQCGVQRFAVTQPDFAYDLAVCVEVTAGVLTLVVEYAMGVCDDVAIVRLMNHYQVVLAGAGADPMQDVMDMRLLTAAEERCVLVDWNGVAGGSLPGGGVHRLVEAQVDLVPDVVAVVCEEQVRNQRAGGRGSEVHHVTYRALDLWANQLAHYVRGLGGGPDVGVGVCLERSIALIVAVVAVLKAGGAYVPLDPSYPRERLMRMLDEVPNALLITHSALLPLVGRAAQEVRAEALQVYREELEPGGVFPVCLDRDWSRVVQMPLTRFDGMVTASQGAYILFTSGSTGHPKGVMCSHANIGYLLEDFALRMPLGRGERWSLWTSLSFDVSVYEVFSALTSGGTLHVVPDGLRADVNGLLAWMCVHQITSAYVPPFMVRALRDWVRTKRDALMLRRLLVGVEPIAESLLAEVRAGVAGLQIYNGYGPTEATVCATMYAVPLPPVSAGMTPIGRPMRDTCVYVLDARMRVVPIGVVGELYIGGAGLARGYVNRPDLTAERFVPNPFGAESAKEKAQSGAPDGDDGVPASLRLYRTGDLVRWRVDGQLEFVGRIDQQVKVRGFRIELGEVEVILRQHPAVRDGVVVAREDVPGERWLVAYVVLEVGALGREDGELGVRRDASLGQVRDFLAARLPDYMVPAVVCLDALPLTPSGKLDRRALPAPAAVYAALPMVAPHTPIEEMLARMCAEVLGVDRVSMDQNFFALGGHSLIVAQVVARVYEECGVELAPRQLFVAQTLADVAEVIAQGAQESYRGQLPPIRRASRDEPLPLAFPQERVWFLESLMPGTIAYHAQISIRFTGSLQIRVLRRALTEIVRRHEILRTSFVAIDGQPAQCIHPPLAVMVPLVDLRALPADERERHVEALIAAAIRRPFDLAAIPLARWMVFQTDAEDFTVLQVEHHFVHDGWSLAILLRELKVLYSAFVAGDESPLADPPIQYADFAVWQRTWLQGEAMTRLVAYWKAKLAGSPLLLALPTDRPRPKIQGLRGDALRIVLPPELYAGLHAVSVRAGATLFMTLLAAFDTLLFRYTGQDDLLVGSGVANRTLRAIEGMIGMVVNTIVLRCDVSGNPTFHELIGRVRDVSLEAYAHQDMPFDRLVEELHIPRDLSRNPLFQVMFSFHNSPVPDLEFAGLVGQVLERHNGSAKTDLNIIIIPYAEQRVGRVPRADAQCLTIIWEYNCDLFDATTIARMVTHYRLLLEGIVADADQRLAALPLLSEQELGLMLGDWNATQTLYTHDASVHRLVAVQAAQQPDAIALVAAEVWDAAAVAPFGVRQVTYAELNARANQCAHYFRSRGVGLEVRVGIGGERSLELVIGMLGILKAGGAYVPLDLHASAERLDALLTIAQVAMLLTAYPQTLGAWARDRHIMVLQADWKMIAQCPTTAVLGGGGADTLVYCIASAGSVGPPKVVEITHGSVVRLVHPTTYAELTPQEVFLHHTPLTFDASTFELWGSLANGARVALYPSGFDSLKQLGQVVQCWQVTMLWLTAGLFHQIVDTQPAAIAPLHQVLTGGDVLSAAHVGRALQVLARGQVVNNYGPTETSTFTTYFPLRPGDMLDANVPIGRPLANTQVYVLDRFLNPVPIGVYGEVCIGGAGLARGYCDRPDLTAERFVPNPFGGDRGKRNGETYRAQTRLYRTGDVARWRTDGVLTFLGRSDQQRLVRGHRIDLHEIAAVLRTHAEVQDAAVVMREDVSGESHLVAYVVLRPTPHDAPNHLTTPQLYAFLRERLPDYLVPTAFVPLATLPLTASGKLNRQALPEREQAASPTHYMAPRSPTERTLAAIWAAFLGVKQVGVHDNFFALGGHSLLATRVIARVRRQFDVNLSADSLFTYPTIAALAAEIARLEDERADDALLADLLAELESRSPDEA